MDNVTWAALTLALTLLGGIWTWRSFRRRGLAYGLRAAGITLLPVAAYLTRTLQMFSRIVDAVASWATNLVFNPFVWTGVVLFGVAILLIATSAVLRSRGRGGSRAARAVGSGDRPGELPSKQGRGAPAIDDEMAEIEALLRKRGIS